MVKTIEQLEARHAAPLCFKFRFPPRSRRARREPRREALPDPPLSPRGTHPGGAQKESLEKGLLLDAFEAKFADEYNAWQAERKDLEARLKALEDSSRRAGATLAREAARRPGAGGAEGDGGRRRRRAPGFNAAELEGDVAQLEEELEHARDKEILLLEAYEQLERDIGREVESALVKQRARLEQLEAALREREGRAQAERQSYESMQKQLADAQRDLDVRGDPHPLRPFHSQPPLRRPTCSPPDRPVSCVPPRTRTPAQVAKRLNFQFEQGQYGLPEAMRDQRKLRADIKALRDELDRSVLERNRLMKELDGAAEEARFLRKQAGIPEEAQLDMGGFRQQTQAETAQLRALNAQLEREVAELEEERRRLRNELRFRAKWQGAHAARLGLSARQLQALEEYADALREGKRAAQKAVGPSGDELASVGVVADLEVQVRHLQQRLAAALAHGGVSPEDTPPEVVQELRRQLGAARAEVVAMEEELEKERREAGRLGREAEALRQAVEAAGPSAALGPVLEALRKNREEAAAAAAAAQGQQQAGGQAGAPPGSAAKGTPLRGRAANGAQTDAVGDYGAPSVLSY